MIETVPQLNLRAARAMAQAAFANAMALNCAIVVVILDAGGQILLVERGPLAPIASVEIARRKAESAVFFGVSTEQMAKASRDMPALASLPHMLPF